MLPTDIATLPYESLSGLDGLLDSEWTTTQAPLYALSGNGPRVANGTTTSTSAAKTPGPSGSPKSAEVRYQEASAVLRKAIRQSESLRTDAEAAHNVIVDRARSEADAILERARSEAQEILDRAKTEARTTPAPTVARDDAEALAVELAPERDGAQASGKVTLVRSGEISTREFPRARGGVDPASVRKWLEVVELSYAILEEELDLARAEWERALETLSRTRTYLIYSGPRFGDGVDLSPLDVEVERAREQWERSVQLLSRVRTTPSRSTFQALLVNASQFEGTLRRRWRGYCPTQVARLIDSLATQLSRVQAQVDVLRAENEQLRDRILWQVADPVPLAPAVLNRGEEWMLSDGTRSE